MVSDSNLFFTCPVLSASLLGVFWLVDHSITISVFSNPCLLSVPQVLGVILVILCFAKVFFILWEISQGISQAPAFLISPAVVGITTVILPLFCCVWPSIAFLGWILHCLSFSVSLGTKIADGRRLETYTVSFCCVTQQGFGVGAECWVYSYGPCGRSTAGESWGSSV